MCADFAAKSVKCDAEADYNDALAFCTDTLVSLEATVSAECSQAYEDVLACAVQVSCEEFNAEEEVPPACQSLSNAFAEICDLGGSTGGSTGSATTADTDGGSGTDGRAPALRGRWLPRSRYT